MDRRKLTKLLFLGLALQPLDSVAQVIQIKATRMKIIKNIHLHRLETTKKLPPLQDDDAHIKDYLSKIRHPNRPHKDDILLSEHNFATLKSVVNRFLRIRQIVGHGHFCVIDFDDALKISKQYPKVGRFSKRELTFIEELFYKDANCYGFKGERQLFNITDRIDDNKIYKVPYTGNYLFKGESLAKYEELKKDIGEKLILTSGIRGVVKQFYLFLAKAYRYNGNMSLASRSLAPPGYSYHATGDFDVGQKGFGGANFSTKFVSTQVFQDLAKQGYVKYRYQKDNMLGVRYEPWHIKL